MSSYSVDLFLFEKLTLEYLEIMKHRNEYMQYCTLAINIEIVDFGLSVNLPFTVA